MKRHSLMTLAAVLCYVLATSLFTACGNIDNSSALYVPDDKPFSYDQYIDSSVRPGDDFFRYQYGGWLDSGTLPSLAEETTGKLGGIERMVLANSNEPTVALVRQLAENAENDDSDMTLLGDRIAYLSTIETQQQLLEAFSQMHQWGYTPVVRLAVMSFEKVFQPQFTSEQPSIYLNYVFQVKDADLLNSYLNKICDRLKNFGISQERIAEITQNAVAVEKLEMQAYESFFNMIRKLQNPENCMTIRRAASQDVKQVCELMGIGDLADQMVESDESEKIIAIHQLIGLLLEGSEQSVAQMRDYMIAYVMGVEMPFLPLLSNGITKENRMSYAMAHAKYLMYRLQVETFGQENIHKEKCTEIMSDFRDILLERIGNLDWMGDATKQAAQKKAKAMDFCIGYPDQWNDELTPHIEANSLLEAVGALRRHEVAVNRQLVGKTMAVCGWDYWCSMVPFTTYNALYDPSNNQLVIFPAFLIAPTFDQTQSEATLYGTACVFGHEMCHGFDARGSKYDEGGAIRDWWQPADKAAFQAKQNQLITLWEQLEHYPGQPANGTFTLAENMADYGGVTLALEAYSRRLRQQGYSGKPFDEQIRKFWLSYGMPIALESRELSVDALKYTYATDVHSAGHNRVNGIVRLFDDWYRLYDVRPTDKLYVAPENRVKIW